MLDYKNNNRSKINPGLNFFRQKIAVSPAPFRILMIGGFSIRALTGILNRHLYAPDR